MLQNCRWPDGTYMNNDFINVINSIRKRYQTENSEKTKNT